MILYDDLHYLIGLFLIIYLFYYVFSSIATGSCSSTRTGTTSNTNGRRFARNPTCRRGNRRIPARAVRCKNRYMSTTWSFSWCSWAASSSWSRCWCTGRRSGAAAGQKGSLFSGVVPVRCRLTERSPTPCLKPGPPNPWKSSSAYRTCGSATAKTRYWSPIPWVRVWALPFTIAKPAWEASSTACCPWPGKTATQNLNPACIVNIGVPHMTSPCTRRAHAGNA